MAKSTRNKPTQLTKKHLDRLHRERMQTRWILIGSGIILAVVLGVIVYGILDQKVLRGRRAVATVNGEKITVEEFQAATKYYRYEIIQNAARMYSFMQYFGGDSSSMSSMSDQFVTISNELEPFRAGNQSLDQLIDDVLVLQEANRRGITIDKEEVELGMQEWMGYYANGTPTPSPTFEIQPTSTLSSLQLTTMPRTATPAPTLIPTTTLTTTATLTQIPGQPTATGVVTGTTIPTPTEIPTPTVTPFPTPTSTPFTYEGYQQVYATVVANFQETYQIPEETLRYIVERQLYRDKLYPLILGDFQCIQEQIWAEHILVDDEALAKDVRQRLDEGEEWDLMARTYSTDTSNNTMGGDLGWFPRGKMVTEFDDAAFALKIGEISLPIKTEFGWHIIRILGHEDRSLTATECDDLKDQKFDEWLTQLRENSEVEIDEIWQEVVPLQPTLPAEIQSIVDQLKPQIPVEFSTPSP